MRKLFIIPFLFATLIGNSQVINLSPDSTLYKLHLLPGTAAIDYAGIELLATLLADTVPLFTFGTGTGLIADTISFNDTTIMGSFFWPGSDTVIVSALRGVIVNGSGTSTVGVQMLWHTTFKSGSATTLNASPFTVNNTTTGNEDTAFDNAEIPPGVWVWFTTPTISVGNRPASLNVTILGYKRNYSY